MSKNQIMIVGDSMTDTDGMSGRGYGAGNDQRASWTNGLKKVIDPDMYGARTYANDRYRSFDIVRGGRGRGGQEFAIPGQTTEEALALFKSGLQRNKNPGIVVLAFTGTNDFLRVGDIEKTKAYVRAMVELAWAAGSRILLIGFPPANDTGQYIPGRRGRDARVAYVKELLAHYAALAAEYAKKDPSRIAYVPDYYAPLRENGKAPSSIVSDGVHVKNVPGVEKKLFDHVMKKLKGLMDAAGPDSFSTKDLVDSSHWWRASAWFRDQIDRGGEKKGGWVAYWTGDAWKASLKSLGDADAAAMALYAKKVAQTFDTYVGAKDAALRARAYARLSELLEYYWLGMLKGASPVKNGLKAPLMFEFDRVSSANAPYDPPGAGSGALLRGLTKGKVHDSLWWRSQAWFKQLLYKPDGSRADWLQTWTTAKWRTLVATDLDGGYRQALDYSKAVTDAYWDHQKARTEADKKAAFARLAELFETWWLGLVKAVTPGSAFGKPNAVFAGGLVTIGGVAHRPPGAATLANLNAEIARQRDLLAQMMGAGAASSGPAVFQPSVLSGPASSPALAASGVR